MLAGVFYSKEKKMTIMQHKEVVQILPGLTSRTLINWTEKGLFEPVGQASGTGTRREYSIYNLIEIGIICELRRYGLRYDAIRGCLQDIKPRLSKSQDFDFVLILRENKTDFHFRGCIGGKINSAMQTMLVRKAQSTTIGNGKACSALVVDINAIYKHIVHSLP